MSIKPFAICRFALSLNTCSAFAAAALAASAVSFTFLSFIFPTPVSCEEPAAEPKQAAAESPDTVIASMNGQKITIGEVDKQIEQKPNFAYILQNSKSNPKMLNDLRRRVVYAMINRQILLDEAKKSSLVSSEEVEQSVNKVVDGYGGKEKLAELLKAIKTDMKTFETEIRKDFTINSYIDKALLKDVSVSDEEIKKEFEKDRAKYAQKESVQARHILIKVEPNAAKADQEAAEKKINEIYKQLVDEKKDFAATASAESQCPSAAQGGDLGTFGKGMMVPEFEQQAFSSAVGEITKPFKTQFGYHIVKVEAHNKAGEGTLESARAAIQEQLLAKKRESIVESKLAELRKGYAVDISL